MKIGRLTPTQHFEIRSPIWGGRKIGLATYKIGVHNEIKITKKNVKGEEIYPQPFYISGDKARKYPTEPVRSNPNIMLHIIPIADLEILERI